MLGQKCLNRSRVRVISTAISFPCRSPLRQFSSFPVSISVPGAGWAAEGLKRRINQTISRQDRVLNETYAICMFLPGKWAQTTLKTTLATSLLNVMLNRCNKFDIMMLPLIRYTKMIRYVTPKNVLYVMEVIANKSKPKIPPQFL